MSDPEPEPRPNLLLHTIQRQAAELSKAHMRKMLEDIDLAQVEMRIVVESNDPPLEDAPMLKATWWKRRWYFLPLLRKANVDSLWPTWWPKDIHIQFAQQLPIQYLRWLLFRWNPKSWVRSEEELRGTLRNVAKTMRHGQNYGMPQRDLEDEIRKAQP